MHAVSKLRAHHRRAFCAHREVAPPCIRQESLPADHRDAVSGDLGAESRGATAHEQHQLEPEHFRSAQHVTERRRVDPCVALRALRAVESESERPGKKGVPRIPVNDEEQHAGLQPLKLLA